ncbi:sodium-dependent transporter [Halalkalicoccus jeotgali]|uniref:Transporter n=1 Tax=Halalkalicoccus jeotgali (strain DSM 18796 / CECT 7217 / JCM 14584 / KCTC 4019 / B3) TaxID=795797 RepID=D8JAQ5_HALJB|nr:sodium-dependent transporter [Halalkalicoccus jeotgali]ADJ14777.1 sodium-dependent transporter [Halalkalicoccus jeotgali B3]ELY39359.1 sodium-dependent transporter [Halalkalicoccus jeotgali B3]
MSQRETWATRTGFILAAVGSAVGLGNIWRFPFQTSANGGAAFLVVYLAAVLLIGIPVILAEFAIGRRANVDAVKAFRNLDKPNWRFVGAIGILASFWTLSYYSVVGGWVTRYIAGSVTGNALAAPESYFGAVSAGVPAVITHAIFIAVTIGIVAFGIERGIELATKFMVPSIVVLLVILAGFAATLPGAGEGYAFFLSPDFGVVAENWQSILPAAFGQALFSLSLGFSVMITYASYLGSDDSLYADGLAIAITNTFVGVLAGLVVMPLLFAQGVPPGEGGAGAVFIAIPTALAELPGGGLVGQVIGVVFFAVVFIAALSSAISLLEAVVAYAVDTFGIARAPAAVGLGIAGFLLGIPSALDTAWLDWFDGLGVTLFLPLAVLAVVVFVGWIMGGEAVDELRRGSSLGVGPAWLWSLRTFVLVVVLVVVALNFNDLFLTPETGYYIVPAPLQ